MTTSFWRVRWQQASRLSFRATDTCVEYPVGAVSRFSHHANSSSDIWTGSYHAPGADAMKIVDNRTWPAQFRRRPLCSLI